MKLIVETLLLVFKNFVIKFVLENEIPVLKIISLAKNRG